MDKVIHFEIPVDNMSRAEKFYHMVFGWKIKSIPQMKYTLVYTTPVDEQQMHLEKGAINGGMYKRDEDSSKHPVIVIQVDSVEEKIKQIFENGGKVVRDITQVGDMGLYAQVKDTEGNIIGIWENIPKKKDKT